jgi:hypothetical protein
LWRRYEKEDHIEKSTFLNFKFYLFVHLVKLRRSVKTFFAVETLAIEYFQRELNTAISVIEDKMHHEEEKVEKCQSALEINKGIDGKTHEKC